MNWFKRCFIFIAIAACSQTNHAIDGQEFSKLFLWPPVILALGTGVDCAQVYALNKELDSLKQNTSTLDSIREKLTKIFEEKINPKLEISLSLQNGSSINLTVSNITIKIKNQYDEDLSSRMKRAFKTEFGIQNDERTIDRYRVYTSTTTDDGSQEDVATVSSAVTDITLDILEQEKFTETLNLQEIDISIKVIFKKLAPPRSKRIMFFIDTPRITAYLDEVKKNRIEEIDKLIPTKTYWGKIKAGASLVLFALYPFTVPYIFHQNSPAN